MDNISIACESIRREMKAIESNVKAIEIKNRALQDSLEKLRGGVYGGKGSQATNRPVRRGEKKEKLANVLKAHGGSALNRECAAMLATEGVDLGKHPLRTTKLIATNNRAMFSVKDDKISLRKITTNS